MNKNIEDDDKNENGIAHRNSKELRQIYLSKLVYDKIWITPNEKPKSH